MDKNKYNRAAKDASQLQQFVDETCENLPEGSAEALSWASEMKSLISYDEESDIITLDRKTYFGGNVIVDGIQQFVNEDEDSFFPDLQHQAGKAVKVNADETGFEYGDAPVKFTTGYNITELPLSILNSVKVGDVVEANLQMYTANIVESDRIRFIAAQSNEIQTITYRYSSDTWSCDGLVENKLGTKLYKHVITDDEDNRLNIYTVNSTQIDFTSITTIQELVGAIMYLQPISMSYGDTNEKPLIYGHGTLVGISTNTQDSSITVFVYNSIDFESATDTVTPL